MISAIRFALRRRSSWYPGQSIRIEVGPLKGMEGVVLSVNGHDRLQVSITLLQRPVSVDLGSTCVHPSATPVEARFLILLLMRGPAGDALLGCLDEGFHKIARDPELGIGRARFWYWFQVFVSLRPLTWAFVKRVTGLAAAYEAIRKVLK
jgi:hypothetical protein